MNVTHLPAQSFYDAVAPDYDNMTGFDARFEHEYEIMRTLAARFRFKRVLDAACGTGIHSIALSRLGVDVTGIDISSEMIAKAAANAERHHTPVTLKTMAAQDLISYPESSYDGILFLGNSLPHILDKEELINTFRAFSHILKADKTLIIQLLNYEKVLSQNERIVSIKKTESFEYIRFYDFLADRVRFNILSIDHRSPALSHSLQSSELYPYLLKDITPAIETAGLHILETFGSFDFDQFNPDQSQNLIIIAKK